MLQDSYNDLISTSRQSVTNISKFLSMLSNMEAMSLKLNLPINAIYSKIIEKSYGSWETKLPEILRNSIEDSDTGAVRYCIICETIQSSLDDIDVGNPAMMYTVQVIMRVYLSNLIKAIDSVTRYFYYLSEIENIGSTSMPEVFNNYIKKYNTEILRSESTKCLSYLIVYDEGNSLLNDTYLFNEIQNITDEDVKEFILNNIYLIDRNDIFQLLNAIENNDVTEVLNSMNEKITEKISSISPVDDYNYLFITLLKKHNKVELYKDLSNIDLNIVCESIVKDRIMPGLESNLKEEYMTYEFDN